MIEDLNALRVFLAVSTCGNMTAAAKGLGLTQSAVSQSIRQLEDDLGTVLLNRAERPLKLTAAGMVLQRHAVPLVEDAAALVTVVRQAGASKMHELRIGIIDSFAATVGPSLIRSLLSQVERLAFRSGLAHDQAEGLLSRNLDLIISSDAMDDVDGLDRYPILTEPFVLLLPEKLAAANAKPELKTLASGHALIRYSARSQIGAQIERHLRRLGVKAPRLLEVDATDALMAMVGAGLGWAIATPLCLLQARSQIANIRVLPFPAPGFNRQLHLFARAGEYGELPQRVAQLACDILKRDCVPELRKLVPWLRGQFAIARVAR
ncbi:MAG: LysR family transcriptional regulator [Burkholderiales bacterium]